MKDIFLKFISLYDEKGIRPFIEGKRGHPSKFLFVSPNICFFKIVDLPRGVKKVDRQFVEFNYANLSPYSNPSYFFSVKDGKLMLWFYPQPPSPYPVVLPLGYIATFLEKSGTKLIKVPLSKDNVALFLIVEGVLVSEVVHRGEEGGRRNTIEMIKKKHRIEEIEIVELAEEGELIRRGLESLSFLETLNLFIFPLFSLNLFKKIIDEVRFPLILLLIALMVNDYSHYVLLGKRAEALRFELKELKEANLLIESRLKEIKKYTRLWEAFYKKEFQGVPLLDIAERVAESVQEAKGQISWLRLHDDKLTAYLIAKDLANLIEALMHTGLFEEIKIVGTVRKERKGKREWAQIEGRIRRND
ncbi:hypothetical protein DRN43_06105 [Thermococci archaeon]|nr:MAG: hypothetical protein DRN43_06105 [Thermococci archaeon]